jgi:hypothetical protein
VEKLQNQRVGGRARGPIAQLAEPPAHNRSVPGSNPGGPTSYCAMKIGDKAERDSYQPGGSKKWLLSGGQGAARQPKSGIPMDSEERVRRKERALFLSAIRNQPDSESP